MELKDFISMALQNMSQCSLDEITFEICVVPKKDWNICSGNNWTLEVIDKPIDEKIVSKIRFTINLKEENGKEVEKVEKG